LLSVLQLEAARHSVAATIGFGANEGFPDLNFTAKSVLPNFGPLMSRRNLKLKSLTSKAFPSISKYSAFWKRTLPEFPLCLNQSGQ
jgi:hypothetical protein